jgi:GDP-mannose 6-dehydrogenase
MVALIEMLIGKGYEVSIYDRSVSLANLHGANRAYIEQEIPHVAQLMRESMREVIAASELLVIGNRAPEFKDALAELRPDQIVLDLVRIADAPPEDRSYVGICW